MALLDDALAVAATGLPVFPCGRSKRPCIPSLADALKAGEPLGELHRNGFGRGFLDATTAPDDIDQLFHASGAALIGVPTGEAAGFDILDVDYRNGGATWEQTEAHRLPETRVHTTQHGGRHYLFRHVPGVRNNASKLAPGIDIRGDGGYAVVPPSNGYTVASDAEIAEWPDWLLELVLARSVREDVATPVQSAPRGPISSRRLEAFVQACCRKVAASVKGQKHWTLRNMAISVGGILDQAGMTDSEASRRLMDALPAEAEDRAAAAKTVAWGLAQGRLRPIVLEDRPFEPPPGKPVSLFMPLAAKGNGHDIEPLHEAEETEDFSDWQDYLQTSPGTKGRAPQILPSFANLELIIRHDPIIAGMLAYNEFIGAPVMLRAAPNHQGIERSPGEFPRAWVEDDVSALHSFIERTYSVKFRSALAVERAMLTVAVGNRFHPIRDWINGLTWDGNPRLDFWLLHTFGIPDTHYSAAVAAKVLIAAVRRVRSPGCKFDHMLVLQGDQDFGKSLTVETLAGTDFYSDSLPLDFANKDAMAGLAGYWFVELAEIEHLDRNTSRLAKGFISRHTDIFRSPYARQQVAHKRQCVLVGTTNEKTYLRDETGNRRYWPVECLRKADLEWLAANRTQLFAEAAQRESTKEILWIDPQHDPQAHAEATAMQAERLESNDDVWLQPIREYLTEKPDCILMSEVLTDGIQLAKSAQHKGHARRVGQVMRYLGWASRKSDSDKEAYPRDTRYWFRIGGVDDPDRLKS